MVRLIPSALAISAVLALAGCGGGGSSSSGGSVTLPPTSTPGPSPTPTPGPTPTPPPTFTYTQFDNLTGDQDFPTSCINGTGRGSGVSVVDALQWFATDGVIDYTEATDTWSVGRLNSGDVADFGPTDLVSSTADLTEYEKLGTNPSQTFSIIRPSTGMGAAQYARISDLRLVDPSGFVADGACIFGVPTDPDDIPSSTTVNYNSIFLEGIMLEENPGGAPLVSTIANGSGTITGNTVNGEISFSLSYSVTAPDGSVSNEGPFTGTVSIDLSAQGRAGYLGELSLGGRSENNISGGFFGPQGRETAFTLHANVDDNFDGFNERVIVIRGFANR